MIDSAAPHASLTNELQEELVRFLKDRFFFHPNGGQVIDVEKPPIIDFLRCHLPGSEPIRLFIEQGVQEIEALRPPPLSVEHSYIVEHEVADDGTLVDEGGQSFLDDFLFAIVLCDSFGISLPG